MASPGQRLRELILAPGILVMPGIYDGFSARLVAAADCYLSAAERERKYGDRA